MSGDEGSKLLVIVGGVFVLTFLPIIIVIALILGSIAGLDDDAVCQPGGGYPGGSDGFFAWPTPPDHRSITSDYGDRVLNGRPDFHNGIDIGAPVDTPVYAGGDGTVRFSGWDSSGGGNLITIEHDGGFETLYMHNSRLIIPVDRPVRRGQEIARSGNSGHSSGPHVHFEVRLNGESVDPMPLLQRGSNGSDSGGGQSSDGSPTILGPSSVTVEQIVSWYRSEGRPDPDGQINGPGPSLQQLVGWYVNHGNREGVRGDIAFVQAVHETGNFGNSDSGRYNFAGIGHYDDAPAGYDFPSAEAGVIAQLQLLKKVASGNNVDLVISPDYAPNWAGRQATTWAGLTGNWATDPNYWPALASIYQDLLAHAGVQGPVPGSECAGPGQGPDGPVDTDWPTESATVPDPSGTGGMVTPRTAAMFREAEQNGLTTNDTACYSPRSWGEHPLGRACDFMMARIGTMPDAAGLAKGWALANWAVRNQNRLGVYYVIWNGKIWTASRSDEGWRPYQSSYYNCPDPSNLTGCHYDHVHISMY